MSADIDLLRGLIQARIAGRDCVWYGVRATDAHPVSRLLPTTHVFALICPSPGPGVTQVCLEHMLGRRVEHNSYSPDDPRCEGSSEFVGACEDAMRHAVNTRSFVVIPYRPTQALTSIYFPRQERMRYLGMFFEQQRCFEHKPWLETELASVGVRTLPWVYVSDREPTLIREMLDGSDSGVVLRTNRSDGGLGLTIVQDERDLPERLPSHTDGFLAAAPLLQPNIPLNVNACVTAAGRTAVHAASYQLIGVPVCAQLPLGFCGNDFGAIRDLDPAHINQMEAIVCQVGGWLAEKGYRGAFGVDMLLHKGYLYVTEVNPRFQCSSPMAADISRELNEPDMYLDHIAAFMGIDDDERRMPLVEMVRSQPPMSQVICYNQGPFSVHRSEMALPWLSAGYRLTGLPAPGIEVAPGAMLFTLFVQRSVTTDGASLAADVQMLVESIRDGCFAVGVKTRPTVDVHA
jgi:hypothetical protein